MIKYAKKDYKNAIKFEQKNHNIKFNFENFKITYGQVHVQ